MEEERIQKFKDLILNKHYCDDCNNLCAMAETFPLKFVAKYIIKLEKELENSIPKAKVEEGLNAIEYYFYRLNGLDEDIEYIQEVKQELLKDGGE